jgi:hypothetical protein
MISFIIMLAAEHCPGLFANVAPSKGELLEIHRSKISLHVAKAAYIGRNATINFFKHARAVWIIAQNDEKVHKNVFSCIADHMLLTGATSLIWDQRLFQYLKGLTT